MSCLFFLFHPSPSLLSRPGSSLVGYPMLLFTNTFVLLVSISITPRATLFATRILCHNQYDLMSPHALTHLISFSLGKLIPHTRSRTFSNAYNNLYHICSPCLDRPSFPINSVPKNPSLFIQITFLKPLLTKFRYPHAVPSERDPRPVKRA